MISTDEATQIALALLAHHNREFKRWVRTALCRFEGVTSYIVVFEYPDTNESICPASFSVCVPLDGQDPTVNYDF